MMKTKRELERERQQQQQQQQETAAIAIAGFGMAAGSASEAGGYQDNWRPAMRERPLPFDVDSEARMAEQQAAAAAGARAAADDGGMDDLDDDDDDDGDDSAQAGGSKPRRARAAAKRCGKGLRHFSSKVSDQVQSRGTTTYIEVANHLVQEFHAAKVEEAADAAAIGADVPAPMNSVYEEKNIRRRVYDALNVLLALNIITRERKAIRWVGVPTDFAQTAARLERELDEKRAEVKRKREELSECVSHLIAVRRCRMAMEANSRCRRRRRRRCCCCCRKRAGSMAKSAPCSGCACTSARAHSWGSSYPTTCASGCRQIASTTTHRSLPQCSLRQQHRRRHWRQRRRALCRL
eukprot:TRINITY_DN1915_c0_g1_i3.p1 TRINITY_DN1915_c0_g1~~TRINITY_DN1915_c0_g1_i3.p1  ORF type:complete len:384 (-),score=121.13 TRINITY_DN1915_c0_g1_i3:117-1169(-)